MIYEVKLAGSGSVISEKVEADHWSIIDGVLSFWHGRKNIFSVGVNRLISVRPR